MARLGNDAKAPLAPLAPLAAGLLSAGMGLLLWARFNAVNGVILPFLQRAVDPGLYRLDPYIAHSIVPNSTPLFDLLALWRLDLTQPAFLVPTYLLVSAASAVAVWRMLRGSFGVDDRLLALALLFALAFADFKLIGFNKSSWMLEHNFSFTFLAAALRFWFLAFLLERRLVAMAALLVPINLLSFKVGWPLVGFAGLALIGLRCWSPVAWGLVALSLVVPGWAALHGGVALDSAASAHVFAVISHLHASEDNPFAGPRLQTPIFLAGMAFAAWRLRSLPRELVIPIGAVLAGSLLVWLIGGIYLSWGGAIHPLPIAVMLSPARAMELAAFLAYLLLLLWISQTPALGGVDRALFALSAMLLKITDDGKWIKLALVLAVLGLAWMALRRLLGGRNPAALRWADRLPLPLFLAGVAVPIGLFFALNLSGQRTAYRLDPVLGFRDSAIPADALPMLRQMARDKGDRRILFVSPRNGWKIAEWNDYARKSGFEADPYYLPSPAEIDRQTQANAHADAVVAGLRAGRVAPAEAAYLAGQGVSLVVPAGARGALPGWSTAHDFGGWVELTPPAAR